MNVSHKNIDELNAVLTVEIKEEDYKTKVETALANYRKNASIPGFRKGKVPQAMIEQRVGRPAILDEAINSSISPFYSAALKEQNVFVIGRPNIEVTELVDREKFSFTAEVDVRPELKLPDFSKITLTVEDVVISDAEVAEQVDELRARFGTLSTVEKAVENGDFVSLDLVATINGEAVDGGTANGNYAGVAPLDGGSA